MLFLLAEADAGYSQYSYYTTLGLFLMSFPGLYSLVKRSPQAKVCLLVLYNRMNSFFLFYALALRPASPLVREPYLC